MSICAQRRLLTLVLATAACACAANTLQADTPALDRARLRAEFAQRLPGVALESLVDGAYALDIQARAQWQQMMEFPPFTFALERGENNFRTPFANGGRYADCFGQIGREQFPLFDPQAGEIVTLEGAINRCRVAKGAAPLSSDGREITELAAFIASTANGRQLQIHVPDDRRAEAAYWAGREFFFTQRGRLELSCADCHVKTAGRTLRAVTVSPALGHPTHWPAWRLEWGELGTLHRRFADCSRQVGATPLPAQSEEYRNLEYFLSYLSNDLEINAPGLRR